MGLPSMCASAGDGTVPVSQYMLQQDEIYKATAPNLDLILLMRRAETGSKLITRNKARQVNGAARILCRLY